MDPTDVDLTARSRGVRLALRGGLVLVALIAVACLFTLVAGPETATVRWIAGAAGLLLVLLLVGAAAGRRRRPYRLLTDHEGLRILDGRGRPILRLAWSELAGVGVMTNEFALARRRLAATLDGGPRGLLAVPIWLELFPADADAVARHPELQRYWAMGAATAPGDPQRWLLIVGDGRGQDLPIGAAVEHWRPDLWRGHRSGSLLFGSRGPWRGLPTGRG